MPFTASEAIQDLPEILVLVQQIAAGVAALPVAPAPRKAADYSALIVSILPSVAKLIDEIEVQVKS